MFAFDEAKQCPTTHPQLPSCTLCQHASCFYANKNGFSVYRCSHCRLLFIHPLPSLATARNLYGEDYFRGATAGFGYVNYERDKQCMRRTFLRYLRIIEKLTPDRTLLDVGTSTGFFLQLAQRRGWTVSGVELSPFASACAQSNGFAVHTGTLETADLPHHSFSAITCWDVLEHVVDPSAFLTKANLLLKKDGLLCINTPTSDSLWARLWGPRWNAILPPEHTFLFNRRNLTALLEKTGFEVELSLKIPKSFSISYIFQVIYRWTGIPLCRSLSAFANTKTFHLLPVPLDVRDNIILFARKVS